MVELNHSLLCVVRTGVVPPAFVVQQDSYAEIGKNILVFKEQAEKSAFSAFL
jgi:hypothetical protein